MGQEVSFIDLAGTIQALSESPGTHVLATASGVDVSVTVLTTGFNRHRHPEDDEILFILEGRLRVHLDDGPVELGPRQGLLVPRGIPHRSEPVDRAVVLSLKGTTGETVPPLRRV